MQWAFYIGLCIPALPAGLSIFYWKLLNVPQRWFGVLMVIITFLSVSGRIWAVFGPGNNLPFFHTYILVEFLMLMVVFAKLRTRILPLFGWWSLAVAFSLAWTWNVFWGEGWWGYPAHIHALEAMILVMIAVAWFLSQFRRVEYQNIATTFEFWLCTGLLTYFCSNLLLFVFSTFIVAQEQSGI